MPLTDVEKTRYEDLFKAVDKNGNGKLSVPEMVKLVRSMGWDRSKFSNLEIYNWFMETDTDDDHEVELDEFLAACEKRPRSEVDEANLRRTLLEMDGGSTGTVTTTQAKDALGTCNIKLNEADPIIAKADKSNDGKINVEEFIALINFSTMLSKESAP